MDTEVHAGVSLGFCMFVLPPCMTTWNKYPFPYYFVSSIFEYGNGRLTMVS